MKYKVWFVIAACVLLLILGVVIASKALGQCKADFPAGTEVTLTAKACPNWTFLGWTGDCEKFGKKKTCVLIMNKDMNVGLKFLPKAKNLQITMTEEEKKYCSRGQSGYVLKSNGKGT